MIKVVALMLVGMYLLAPIAMADPFKLNKLQTGVNNVVYGSIETPDNINATNSKGTKAFSDCTDKTKDDVGRTIVRVVGGAYQMLTFWYPKD